MPSAGQDGLPEQQIAPGYASRFADWGGMTVAFEHATAGQDATAMLADLPDGRCQAPHWGYLFTGRIVVDYGDRTEVVEGGNAYYIEPGHRISFETDCDALEFTPTEALERTFDAIRRHTAAGGETAVP